MSEHVTYKTPSTPITSAEARVYDKAYPIFKKHLAPLLRTNDLTKEEFIKLARTSPKDPRTLQDLKTRAIITLVGFIARAEVNKSTESAIQMLNRLG